MKKKSELSLETLEQLGSAKGISTEVIVDIIKESFKFAYTKKLDEEILSICNNESEKYNQFLDIFYKIIYIKYIKQIEETNK